MDSLCYPLASTASTQQARLPNRYLSNEAVVRRSNGRNTDEQYMDIDYIQPPSSLQGSIGEFSTIFGSVQSQFAACVLSEPMKKVRNSLIEDMQALFDLVINLCEAHRLAARAIREVTDNYGPRDAPNPKDILRKARGALSSAMRNLAIVARRLLERSNELRTVSNAPPGYFKQLVNTWLNRQIGIYSASSAIMVSLSGGGYNLYQQLHPEPQMPITEAVVHISKSNVVVGALTVAGVCIGATSLMDKLSPDAAAYKRSNLNTTQGAMEQIHDQIIRLMDVMASLELYWGNMRRGPFNTKDRDAKSLLRVAAVLDQHVNDARTIADALRSNFRVDSPRDLPSRRLIAAEQMTRTDRTLYGHPQILAPAGYEVVNSPRSSMSSDVEYTYPPISRNGNRYQY